jgi:hypothetical protein
MTCMICGGTSQYYFSKTYNAPTALKAIMAAVGTVDYYRCGNCGFTHSKTHQELAPALWSELNESFHHYIETDPSLPDLLNQPPYAEQAFMLAYLKSHGMIDGDNMLDYAAGYGTLSKLLKGLFQVTLPIFDPYVKGGDLGRYVGRPLVGTYGTVINSAYFEHVLTRGELDAINNYVSDDGCLVIHSVICENVPRDPEWFYLGPPVHTAFHTNKSMDILMKQWGYQSSIYSPQAKCWVLYKKPYAELEETVLKMNKELQAKWFYGKDGFMDYWKGF